jgi:poly(3-hydroxybutyrate) depolymerase
MRAWTIGLLLVCSLASATARAQVVLAPASDGHLGAWLLAGPSAAADVESAGANAAPVLNGTVGSRGLRYKLVAVADGAIDVAKELGVGKQAGPYAWAGATLDLSEPLDGWLLVSADGGVKATVAGRTLLDRDVARLRDSSWDVVPLKLDKGRHPLLLRLHHTGEHWAFAVRILDKKELLVPRGLSLSLEGTSAADATRLAGSMLSVSLETGIDVMKSNPLAAGRYQPRVHVEYRRGRPRGVPGDLTATLNGLEGGARVARLGRIAVTERGVHAFEAELHPIAPEAIAAGPARRHELVLQIGPTRIQRALILKRDAPKLVRAARSYSQGLLPKSAAAPSVLKPTLEWRARRLARIGAGRRASVASVERAASALEALLKQIDIGDSPMFVPGVAALARESELDGRPQRVLVHVPRSYQPGATERYPLVVLLHGYNGSPRSVMRAFLDTDSTAPHPAVNGFIVAPHAHGNTFYRGPGEREVMQALDWMLKDYRIDRERVSISGVSMGGTGTAHLALRYADRFAAAAPLCGYQSFFVRRDIKNRPLRTWEQDQMHHWSPASWAENGRFVPLHVAHGTKDFPLENSKVLIESYRKLGYSLVEEWPDIGHSVWEVSYKGARLWPWLSQKRKDPEPARVTLKTDSLRYGRQHWIAITELERPGGMGSVDAHAAARDRIAITTRGVRGIKLERPLRHVHKDAPLSIDVGGTALTFAPTETVELVRAGDSWQKGSPKPPGAKRAHLEGAIRDVYLERLAFVWGATDPATARANRELAEWLARLRYGADVHYPVLPDTETDAALEKERSLVLVGSARDHRLIRELEPKLPVRVTADGLTFGGQTFRGEDVGAIFIRPNPRQPERYVLVVTAPRAPGIWRALSLPALLPDFMLFDSGLAPAAGQQVLGSARVLAAGFFERDWSVPKEFRDAPRGP